MPQAVDLSAAQLSSQRVEVKRLASAIADGGVSTSGLTASMLGSKFVAYLGFDTQANADKAMQAIDARKRAAYPVLPTAERPAV